MRSVRHQIESALTSYDGLSRQELEEVLLDQLRQQIQPFLLPDTRLTDDSRQWRAMSAYQKSVRRHDLETALRAGCGLFRHSPSLLLWRMSVVMLEDVGLANPVLGACGLALHSNKNLPNDETRLQLAMRLTSMAASGPNDRSLDHAIILARNSPELSPARDRCAALAIEIPSELVAIYQDDGEPMAHRVIAGLALGGVLESKQRTNSTHVLRNFAEYSGMIEGMSLPGIIKYIATRGAELCVSSHPYILPLLWQTTIPELISVVEMESVDAPTIAGLPSLVFDMHVPEGREAISVFAGESSDLQGLLKSYPRKQWAKLIGVTLFNHEGGDVLQQSLAYPTQRTLLKSAQAAHLAGNGMTNRLHQIELATIVMGNLDILNDIRSSVARPCNQPSFI